MNEDLKDILKASMVSEIEDDLETGPVFDAGEVYNLQDTKGVVGTPVIPMSKVAFMAMQGMSTKDIAEELRVTPTQIRKLKQDEDYKEIVKTITGTVVNKSKELIQSASMKATLTLMSMMDSNSDKIRLTAAQDILNRVGVKEATTVNIVAKNDHTANMSEEELKDLIKLGTAEILGEKKDEPT